MMPQRTLPDYENPPAQETWLSFQFTPLKWSIPHFGAFWNEIKTDYPKFEVHPPIGEFNFQFDAMSPEAVVNFPVRCWFINETDNRLIQVQSTRFFHNWRRPSAEVPYLHYDDLRPLFRREWERFCDFAVRQDMGKPHVLLCEVSYVNHLERGIGWDQFSELSSIFPSLGSFRGREFLKEPETAAVHATYVMPEMGGRLNISIQPAIRQADTKEILQLAITGSCQPPVDDVDELLKSLDACRSWVVKGFDDITSERMHKIWGKK
jgi:uncharacterized protein (TIGR04255 family)